MSNCENITNPLGLKREGTDQNSRFLPSLKPESAPVDAKTVADDLVFTQQLARLVKFFGVGDAHFGDDNWQPFFSQDVSVMLALAAVQDMSEYNALTHQKLGSIRKNTDSEVVLKQNFGTLLNLVTSVAWQIEQLQHSLPDDILLKGSIRNLIRSKLAMPFQKLFAYHQAAVANGLTDETEATGLTLFGTPVQMATTVFNRPFGPLWTDGVQNWNVFKLTIAADDSIYNLPGATTTARRLYFAVTHNFFTAIFDQFLRALSKITTDANVQLQQTLTQRNDHQPHTALFISFLKLLEFARKDANSLTKRHLDLYYKEILQISERKPRPNQVHVIFEAARFLESALIKQGTLLNAGKDSLGNDVAYEIDQDTVINKAKITALHSVYIGTAQDEALDTNPYILEGRVYASPVANSDDGLGAELTSGEKQWHPFASKKYVNGVLEDITMPKAEIGLAIASHYLYLKEGERSIVVEITTGNALPNPANRWEAEVTTAEGWQKLPITASFASNALIFRNDAIPADFPAITAYDPAVHGRSFQATAPVIRFRLKHSLQAFPYNAFKDAIVQKVRLTVGSKQVKDIFVQNPFGILDPSKPFLPFGPLPEKDAYFIIGSDEIFQKKGAQVSTKLAWQNVPATVSPNPPAKIQKLQLGVWQDIGTEANLLDGIGNLVTVDAADVSKPDADGNNLYDVNSTNGFYRFRLDGSFGHTAYQAALTNYLIDKAKESSDSNAIKTVIAAYELPAPTPTAESAITMIKGIVYASPVAPTPPYTPVIDEISLSYTASTEIALNDSGSFTNRSLQFFHTYPFGDVEQHRALKDPLTDHETDVRLLPYFRHYNNGDVYFEIEGQSGFVAHEGEFYMGLSEAVPGQKVAVLFQLDEGSANPRIKKPDNHVHWSFLADNRWISFQKLEVQDSTSQLTRSGIITFTIPKYAGTDNTMLPKGQIWLRASVHGASEAVCKIIAVLPQAASATFKDQPNAGDFLAAPLPAGTVAKLLEPEASIKKLEQPYASFGGRTRENAPDYYKRVSERLRHKDRAITVWDYEHLILEEFSNIYKVRVINHTRYEPNDAGTGIYNELAAGHVTIVPIPDLRTRNAIDPLKPYTNVADLESIEAFIIKRKSCFAKIHVQNPVFEEVKVQCNVKFYPQYDEVFYTRQLKQDITRFLSPWAFGNAAEIRFGGQISKSVLINFIEERAYVDYLTDFVLYHKIGNTLTDKEEITASRAIAILVSVPAWQHIIVPIPHVPETAAAAHCGCD